MTPEFTTFIKTGVLPASMAARSKILDIARDKILSNQTTSKTNTMTIFKNARVVALEDEVATAKAELAQAESERAAAVRELSKLTGESTSAINARKTAAKPVIHRAVTTPSAVVHKAQPTSSFTMPTAEAIAAEIIKQQAAKPLTGLAKVTAAFQKESAEKAAKAKPAARNPEISNLTGLAKVEAAFSAQSKSSN